MSTQTRVAQDDCILYYSIINFLSVEGKVKLNVHEKYYMVNSLLSGVCIFKVLVRGGYLDSDATSSMIRTQLSNLGTYPSQTFNNIVKSRAHVQTLIDTLTSRS